MSQDNIRVGIIGLGMMGRTHYEAYQNVKGCKVVAVADQDPKRAGGDLSGTGGNVIAGGISQLPKDVRGTTDWRELIAMSEVDVIDVCLPTTAHEEVVIAALQTGKHVLCEKPLARTSEQARRIADAARSAKGFFMPAMVMRFWPQWVWLKKVVAEKTYGKVLAATFRRVAEMPAGWYHNGKISGGAALDLHIHDTDFVHHLFGMPRSVFTRGYTMTTGEMDHLSTQYNYDEVPLVTAEGGWTMAPGFGFSMRYLVNFENGATADFDLAREKPLMLSREGKSEAVDCEAGFGYEAELRYFIDCVRNNQRPSTVTAEDGVASVRLVEAECESARSGKIVTL